VNGFVGNTDHDWFTFLRDRQPLEEVNFWQPSGGDAFRALAPGEPFFFRLKKPHYAVGGFGFFAQGTFRVAVTQAYGGACAVSGEHSLPVLDVAHIQGYAAGGPHEVRNGLLLRTDIHRLFDRGYVTVTPECRFEVSGRLREEFENGKTYYALHGREILQPRARADRADPELLRWHNEHVFGRAA
jgi:predicted restriction endonuclease